MWIFLNNSFLSIVDNMDDPTGETLLVRARFKGDLEAVFTDFSSLDLLEVEETPDADYRFRTRLPRHCVASAIAQDILNINYPNFKDSIPEGQPNRYTAYVQTWAVMSKVQNLFSGKA